MSARQRWPIGAEEYRITALERSIEGRQKLTEARRLLRDSQKEAKRNPVLKEMMDLEAVALIADAMSMLADIECAMKVARHEGQIK